jgi:polyhydroxyalkanoate synthesis repressor PhaR
MPYVIKRYANRKLYDTRTKRYLTLDEVAVLVRAGEDVRVEDADSGSDLTGQILAKVLAENHRKGGSFLLPPKILVDLIQHPSETVMDAVRTSVSAGQRTVEQVSGEVGRLIDSVTGRADRARKVGDGTDLARSLDERLRAAVKALGLPTREEFERLSARVAALEAKAKRPAPPSKRPATRAKAPKQRS